MSKIYLYYLSSSVVPLIQSGGVVTFDWGTATAWKACKKPTKKTSYVTYSTKKKDNKCYGATSWKDGDGQSHGGTTIPKKADRTIDGVTYSVDVQYKLAKKVTYTRKRAGKKGTTKYKKMYKYYWNPYWYKLRYKEKKKAVDKVYSEYKDGVNHIYFNNYYYDDNGNQVATNGYLLHPQSFDITYSDVNKNITSNANNSDSRDNTGTYILKKVRVGLMSLSLEWQGLSEEEGADLLNVLNPTDTKSPYINAQIYNPKTMKVENKTFYSDSRSVSPLHNGYYEKISVTLTEV